MAVLGTAFVEVRPEISNFSSQLESKLSGAVEKAQGFGSKIGGALGIGLTGAATGGLLAAVTAIVHLTDTWETAHTQLVTATKDVGQHFDDFSGQVVTTDKKMENLGFTNAQTESSLATLTTVTKNVQTAMGLEGLAADIARGRHIDLSTATAILTKVETGHVALLGRIGIQTKDATGKTISQQQAIEALTKLYGGQASAAAETFGGKLGVLETKASDLGVKIGTAVIPVIEQLVSDGIGVVTWLGDANAATDGWLGRLTLLVGGGALAIITVTKIAGAVASTISFFASAGAAASSFAETIGLVILYNPELAVLAGVVAAGAAAWKLFGGSTHVAAGNLAEIADSGIDVTMQKLIEKGAEASKLNEGFNAADLALKGFGEALKQGVPQAQRWIDAMGRAGLSTDVERKALQQIILAHKQTDAATQKLTGTQQANTAATTASAAAIKAAAAETKAYNDSIVKLATAGGLAISQLAQTLHLTTAQITADTIAIDGWNKAIDSAFAGAATEVITKWGSTARFNLKQFESDLLANTVAAANWSSNLAKAASEGLNMGFLQQLRDAGPKSAPLLQHILDTASKGSIASINAITAFGSKAAAAAKTDIDANILGVQGSWSNFQAWLAAHPANFRLELGGQAASLSMIHDAALASRGGGQKFARGGIATGPASGYPATLHGVEAVLPLNDPARALAVLGDAAKYMGSSGARSASTSTGGGTTIVFAPVFPPGMSQDAIITELKAWTVETLADTVDSVTAGQRVGTGTSR